MKIHYIKTVLFNTTMSAASEPAPVVPKVKISRKERRLLRTIKEQQERTTNTIPAQSFRRIVDEISGNKRFAADAIEALQTASEDHLTTVLSAGFRIAQHSGRDTLTDRDIRLATQLSEVL